MNAKNQGRRVLVVASGLGFLLLVGLLAPPPAQLISSKTTTVTTVSAKTAPLTISTTGIKTLSRGTITIAPRLPVPTLPKTHILVPKQDFENGWGSWSIFPPQPSSSYPIWNLLAPGVCNNPGSGWMASYTKLATCQYGSGLTATQTLKSPSFTCPAAPSGTTSTSFTVSLDYQKQVAASMATTLWISDGFGSSAISMLPDNTGTLVNLSTAVPNAAWYLTQTNTYAIQVNVSPIGPTGPGLNVDNFESRLVYSDSTPCEQLVAQILKEESSLTPNGYCVLLLPQMANETLVLLMDLTAYLPGESPPLAPAGTILGSSFSNDCSVLNPSPGNSIQWPIEPGSLTHGFELPYISWPESNEARALYFQVVNPSTGDISGVTMIPIESNPDF